MKIWFLFGFCLVFVWFLFGFCLVFVWFLFGFCLVFVWFLFGFCFFGFCVWIFSPSEDGACEVGSYSFYFLTLFFISFLNPFLVDRD